jgi:hypothetical protein
MSHTAQSWRETMTTAAATRWTGQPGAGVSGAQLAVLI